MAAQSLKSQQASEREKTKTKKTKSVCVCVCVCEREREKRMGGGEKLFEKCFSVD